MDEWYDNKQLYEMLQKLEHEIAALSKEMAETRTMIRDYNDLRAKVEATAGAVRALQWLTPIGIAALGLLFTVLNYIGR